MATTKDYFTHIGETLQAQVQILAANNSPIDINTHSIQFAVSKEFTTNTISVLSSANSLQISIIQSSNAVIQVNFTPTVNTGYDNSDLVYQLRTVHNSSNTVSIVQEGRIFITPNLF